MHPSTQGFRRVCAYLQVMSLRNIEIVVSDMVFVLTSSLPSITANLTSKPTYERGLITAPKLEPLALRA